MPVRHMAWLKFKEDISPDRIEYHLTACRALVGRIPALNNLECGANYTDRAGGFKHGIIVSVANREALSAYLNHPVHIPIANALKVDVAELRVMDVEF